MKLNGKVAIATPSAEELGMLSRYGIERTCNYFGPVAFFRFSSMSSIGTL